MLRNHLRINLRKYFLSLSDTISYHISQVMQLLISIWLLSQHTSTKYFTKILGTSESLPHASLSLEIVGEMENCQDQIW